VMGRALRKETLCRKNADEGGKGSGREPDSNFLLGRGFLRGCNIGKLGEKNWLPVEREGRV